MFYTGIILLSCTQAKCIKCSNSNSVLFEVLDFYSRIFIFLKPSCAHELWQSHNNRESQFSPSVLFRGEKSGCQACSGPLQMSHLASSSCHFSIKHFRLKPPHFCISHFCVGVVISVSLFV